MKPRLIGVLLAAVFSAISFAQTAQITGRVTDPTGSVVPNADIAITNVDTGVKRDAASNEQGYYTIPSLQPGGYQIAAHKEGFKPVTRTGIHLQADEKARIDFSLEVGAVAETVNVVGDLSLLQTDSSELATSITTREYNRLPLIQVNRMRSPAFFLFLTPGIHGNLNLDGSENISATNQIQVHGSPKQHTEVLVDGLSGGQFNTVGSINEMAPPVDAVLEFKVQASQMSAEYGHTGSAVVNFTIKSGTNQLHGSAFNYFRNDKLDARNWFAGSRALTRQNEFGAVLGGPIVFPKVYNGRDRSFFFFAYSGSRKRGLDNIERVRIATPQQSAGDFSALADSRGNRTLIYDPRSTRPAPTGGFLRDPFPGNVIPADRLDPVAVKVARLFPPPNTSAGVLNYQNWIGEQLLDPDVTTGKIDHTISNRQKLFSTFNWNRIPRLRNRVPLADPINDGFFQNITSRIFRLSHDFFFRPQLLNNLSLGYNRFRNPNGSRSVGGGWPEKLGLTGVPGSMFPVLNFTDGYTTLGSSGLGDSIDQIYFLRDSLTWTRGRHGLKFGVEVRWNQVNSNSESNTSGTYNFNKLGTALPSSPTTTGDGFASFLLGEVQSASLNYPSTAGTRRPYWGFYAQDDLKLTSNLTLNIGMRFEFEQAPYEAADRHSIVDLGVPNPGAGNLPGALIYAGSGPGRTGRRSLVGTDYSGWGPRAGFAWRGLNKTVLRGGYGIYYSNNYLGVSTAGFNISGNFQTLDNGITPAFRLREGFPQNFPREPQINAALLNNQNGTYLEPNAGAMPRTQNWSLGIQREVTANLLVEATYIANHNTRQTEPQVININQLQPQFLGLGSLLTQSVTSAAAVAAGIRVPYPGFTGSVAQALRAYPQYRTLTPANAKAGSSIYHALELRGRKRLSAGLSFDVSYTLSKNLGYDNPTYAGRGGADNILQDNFNRRLERAILPYDITHAFLIQYVYDLPFLRGRRLGGWTLSGIQRYQSGNPLPILMTNNLAIFNRVLRPDVASGQPLSTGISNADLNPNRDRVINSGAFATPAPFRFGTAAPYYQNLRNFAALSEDLSVIKTTAITEKVSTEFNVQFINAFNRHRFAEVDPNFSNASFGTVKSASLPRFIQLGLRVRF